MEVIIGALGGDEMEEREEGRHTACRASNLSAHLDFCFVSICSVRM